MRSLLAAGALVAFCAGSMQAAVADPSTFEIGPQPSTLGVGVEAGASVNKAIDVRANFGALDLSNNGSASGVNYNANAHLNNFGGTLDLHPFLNGFRLSGGLVSGSSNLAFNGVPTSKQTFIINGNTYSVADIGQVIGGATFGGTNPYVGLGFGGGRVKRNTIGVSFDAGVAMEAAPVVTLGTTKNDLPPQAQAQFQTDIAAARNSFANDVNFLKTYPVVRVGLVAHL